MYIYIYTYIEHVDHTVDMSYSYMSYMLHMVCIYIYILHVIYAILRSMIYDRYVVTVASHGSHGSRHRGDVTIAGLASYPALMLAQLVNILEPRQRRSPVDDRTGYLTLTVCELENGDLVRGFTH